MYPYRACSGKQVQATITLGGLQFNPYLFVGGGFGIAASPNPYLASPFGFAEVKVNIPINMDVIPFGNYKIGANGYGVTNDIAVGVTFLSRTKRTGWSVFVGGQLLPDEVRRQYTTHFNFKLGVSYEFGGASGLWR